MVRLKVGGEGALKAERSAGMPEFASQPEVVSGEQKARGNAVCINAFGEASGDARRIVQTTAMAKVHAQEAAFEHRGSRDCASQAAKASNERQKGARPDSVGNVAAKKHKRESRTSAVVNLAESGYAKKVSVGQAPIQLEDEKQVESALHEQDFDLAATLKQLPNELEGQASDIDGRLSKFLVRKGDPWRWKIMNCPLKSKHRNFVSEMWATSWKSVLENAPGLHLQRLPRPSGLARVRARWRSVADACGWEGDEGKPSVTDSAARFKPSSVWPRCTIAISTDGGCQIPAKTMCERLSHTSYDSLRS